jgi:hypothetical protein
MIEFILALLAAAPVPSECGIQGVGVASVGDGVHALCSSLAIGSFGKGKCTEFCKLLAHLLLRMKSRLLLLSLSFTAFACNQSPPNQDQQPPAAANGASNTPPVVTIDNSTILNFLHGKSRGDSAVYDAGKMIESSSSDKQTIAKVIAKRVFQRHDSTLCLAVVKNEFNGAGVNNSWMDGILLYNKQGTWQKLKEKHQMVWGGSFGFCECQCRIQPVNVNGEKKYLAFVKVENTHQGEYEMYSVVTEGLEAQQNEFMVYQSGMSEPCPGFLDINPDTLKIGVMVKPVDAQNDKVEVVAYEERDKNGNCTGQFRARDFTYAQLMQEVRRPRVVLE